MPTRHAQKNLTVMFTDISGFTRHTETISRDALMERLDTHNALLMPIVAHFGGTLVKTIGDAFLITFESPTNAVQCGMLMQHRLRAFNAGKAEPAQIHIKVSVNAGEVTVTETDVFGDPVNVAAKIEKATSPDEIYFTEAVFLAMNKAEVPNAFVKTFRPKGADSHEIKLYKVLQDEDDPVYRHVVDGVRIDEAATRARAAELATTATKEAGRYRDTLEHLVEGQRRSTRTLLVALGLGLAVLGVGAWLGIRSLATGENAAERSLTDGVRTYLSVGKATEAMGVIDAYVATHGHGEVVDRLQDEVATVIWNRAARAADEASLALAAGDAGPAGRLEAPTISAKPVAGPSPDAIRDRVLGAKARAAALDRATERLAAGDVPAARAAAAEAAGPHSPTGALATLLARAEALEACCALVAGPTAAERAGEIVAKLAAAYGDDTRDPAALATLEQALVLELGAVARREGRTAALARREEARRRFKGFSAWASVQREIDLQSLFGYAEDPELRRRWRDGAEELWTLRKDLRAAGAKDPDFLFRVGRTLHEVQQARDEIGLHGMDEVEAAVEADPGLLRRREAEVRVLFTDWLGEEQAPGSFLRRAIVRGGIGPWRDALRAGLSAVSGVGEEAKPDVPRRANAFAILVDAGEQAVVSDRIAFLDAMLGAFVEGSAPQLSTAHAEALFGGAMDELEFVRLRATLASEAERARAGDGPYGSSTDARAHLDALLAALLRAQPAHARR